MSELTRCNYCSYSSIKERNKDRKLVTMIVDGWITVYALNETPIIGQGEPIERNGRPIRFITAYLELTNRCVC